MNPIRSLLLLLLLSLASLSSCHLVLGSCPAGTLESPDGRCFLADDERGGRPDRDNDDDDDDDDEPGTGEGEGEPVVAEGEGEGELVVEGEGEPVVAEGEGEGEAPTEGEGEQPGEGEGEGEPPVEGEGREIEPNNSSDDSGARVVVLEVDGAGVVRGVVGGADGVDVVRVRVARAGRHVLRLGCAAGDDADLDLRAGSETSESPQCSEEVSVDVDRAGGVIAITITAFAGTASWLLEVVAGPDESCETTCFGGCVDLASDRDHCGGCGDACESGADCVAGACRLRVNEQCQPFIDQCVPGACCFNGFCTIAGGC